MRACQSVSTFSLQEELSYNSKSSEELNLPWDVTGDSLITITTRVMAITTIMISVFFLSLSLVRLSIYREVYGCKTQQEALYCRRL